MWSSFERVVRRVAYGIIALFLVGFFVPFVGYALFDGIRRNPRALLGFAREPGCWLIVSGPIVFWVSMIAFYFRLPRDARSANVGTLGRRLHIGLIAKQFRAYRQQRGYDWLLWTVTLSGALTLVIIGVALF